MSGSVELSLEEFSRLHLELLALARACSRGDRDGANSVIDAMELPSGAYISAAGILIATLASRVGPVDEVLDETIRNVVQAAAEGPPR